MTKLKIVLLLSLAACGDDVHHVDAPDGGSAPDAVDAAMDASVVDAGCEALPDAPLPLCSDQCPGEEYFAWTCYGHYLWSYCLPSYARCEDPTARALYP